MKDVIIGIAYPIETITLAALVGHAECFLSYLDDNGVDTSGRKVQFGEFTLQDVSRIECTIYNVAPEKVRLIVPVACQVFDGGEIYVVKVDDHYDEAQP